MENAHIQEASEQINPSLKNGSQFLSEASQGTETYKSSLENSLRQIRGAGSADEVKNVVGALQQKTNQMLDRSRALEK